ncbi:MAG: PEP-CTERM sorting domain-containing protein [Planctomycetota bacterium]
MNKLTLLAAGFAVAAGSSASAATLLSISTVQGSLNTGNGVTDRFDSAAVTITNAANTIAPSASDLITAGADGNGITSLERFWNNAGTGGWFSLADADTGTSVSNFNNGYLAFTLEADAGFFLDLDQLAFDSAVFTVDNRRGFEVYAEVNGGTFDSSSDLLVNINDENSLRTSPRENTANLTGAGYQGISSIEIRVYSLTDLASRTIDVDSFLLTGDVIAIPEPSSLLLLALSSACMLSRRRQAI